jgi:hypothetical protein
VNNQNENLDKTKKGKYRELLLGQELYRFTPEKWQLAENIAKREIKSYGGIKKFLKKEILDQKSNSRRQAKQKARWRKK